MTELTSTGMNDDVDFVSSGGVGRRMNVVQPGGERGGRIFAKQLAHLVVDRDVDGGAFHGELDGGGGGWHVSS